MKKKAKKKVKVVEPVRAPNQEITIVNQTALQPEMVEHKYCLPKTWMSEKQVMKMVQQTPKEHTFTRPAKGGGTWEFVTGTYVKKVLNYVFGWLWDFEIVSEQEKYGSVIVLGKLTVKDGKGGTITKMQYGRAEIKYKKGGQEVLDYGNDCKAAATDALKKCASEFGIAGDIYGKNEFKEAGKTVMAPNSQLPPKTAVMANSSPTATLHNECHQCAMIISSDVAKFSKARYGKPLCQNCQNTQK